VAYANIVVKATRFGRSCFAEGSQTNFDVWNKMNYQLENFHQGAKLFSPVSISNQQGVALNVTGA